MAHYRFNNLLGAPYRGGNLCMSGNHLLTSVGNRVMEVDLQMSSSQTLPCENLTEIRCIAVSPTGSHIISFDTDGRALLVNLRWVPRRKREEIRLDRVSARRILPILPSLDTAGADTFSGARALNVVVNR